MFLSFFRKKKKYRKSYLKLVEQKIIKFYSFVHQTGIHFRNKNHYLHEEKAIGIPRHFKKVISRPASCEFKIAQIITITDKSFELR